jgi:glycosyltransferase involved in cell wall biosynthesis
MNICIVSHIDRLGGIHTFLTNLVNSWPIKKDNFYFYLNHSFPQKKTFLKKFTKKPRINFFLFFLPNFFVFKLLIVPINLFFIFIKFILIFLYNSYDRLLIVSGGYPLSLPNKIILISWCLTNPSKNIYINIHNLNSASTWKNIIFDKLFDILVIILKIKLILVSTSCINSIKKNRAVFKKYNNFKIIYNGVDLKITKLKKINSKSKACLMLSTYEERKGHKFLFNVFKRVVKNIKDAKLLIYGDSKGDEKLNLIKYINSLGLKKNILLNDYSNNNLSLIKNSKIVVVPSRSHESFGYTIIEAMSQKRPVIATNVGGISEVMKNSKAGYLIHKNNSNLFSKKITQILKNKNLQKKLGQNGYNHYKLYFTSKKMAENYFKFII